MKIGFACGVFDVFHAGHALMLAECRKHCDHLIVAVNRAENISDEINPGKRRPVYSFEERRLIIASIKYVDEVMEYNSEEELYQIMRSKSIDVRFLGDDYKGRKITGDDLNIPVVFIDRSHGYSTSSAIQRIKSAPGR